MDIRPARLEKSYPSREHNASNHCCHFLQASSIAELMEKLEDSIMTLNSLSSNRASSPFKETLHSLLKQIQGVEETMQAWLNVQQLWSYMESVFSAGDIAEQLPIETEKFASIDSRFVQITKRAQKNTSVTDICSMDNILEDLLCLLNDLECCQKSLSNYLGKATTVLSMSNCLDKKDTKISLLEQCRD